MASEGGITYDLVMDLTSDYHGKGFHIFMDNYYTSPTLFTSLWSVRMGATGTRKANRKGLPKKLKDVKVDRGNLMVMHKENLMAAKYHDRKIVYLLSTVETATMRDTGRERRGERLRKPNVVMEYDKYMGGVDRADQMLNYTPFP